MPLTIYSHSIKSNYFYTAYYTWHKHAFSIIGIDMALAKQLIEYDNLSINLLSKLAQNALNNISASAGNVLDVACLFFDKDTSKAISDFHKLYCEHSQLNDHKDAVNQQADDILLAAQDPNYSFETSGKSQNLHADEQVELANIQKNLEALIQQDEHIKRRMVPVMQCMQYEDLITNRIQRLISCWSYLVSLLIDPDNINISNTLRTLDRVQSSIDEHEMFYQYVLHANYHDYIDLEDHNIAQMPHNIVNFDDLLERMFKFSQKSLNECIEQTQLAFDELLALLNLITGESKDVAYLFSGVDDSFDDIKAILAKYKNADQHSNNLINEIAATQEQHTDEAGTLIQSFMLALQSQDIIRQNIENIARFHASWAAFREQVKCNTQPNSDLSIEFGEQLMGLMTSHAEREIIAINIPGMSLKSQSEKGELF